MRHIRNPNMLTFYILSNIIISWFGQVFEIYKEDLLFYNSGGRRSAVLICEKKSRINLFKMLEHYVCYFFNIFIYVLENWTVCLRTIKLLIIFVAVFVDARVESNEKYIKQIRSIHSIVVSCLHLRQEPLTLEQPSRWKRRHKAETAYVIQIKQRIKQKIATGKLISSHFLVNNPKKMNRKLHKKSQLGLRYHLRNEYYLFVCHWS